jgi:hypothetical protein
LIPRKLIAGDRVLDAQAALEASDPQPGTLGIELVAPHLDGPADPQAVPVDYEQTGVIANAVAPLGYIDLEQRTLQTVDNPFGPRLSAMSRPLRSSSARYLATSSWRMSAKFTANSTEVPPRPTRARANHLLNPDLGYTLAASISCSGP